MRKYLHKKRFVILKSLIGQGYWIKVTTAEGKKFVYNHDEVFAVNQERILSMKCFHEYGSYTSSKNLPTWARLDNL